MHSQETLREFLQAFKVAFKNAAIYHKDHPSLHQSIGDLKSKLDILLNIASPLKISFTSSSLNIGSKILEKESLFNELSHFFHLRKLKSLAFFKGVTDEELMILVHNVYLPPRDILRKGGIKTLLRNSHLPHVQIEELDYSMLLKEEGEEIKDIWPFLLNEALEKDDHKQIQDIIDHFEKILEKIPPEDFSEDEELNRNFIKFFTYLKEKDKKSYEKCTKSFVQSAIKKKSIPEESRIDKIKMWITDMTEKDLASILAEEIELDENFDPLSLSVFTKLTEKKKHSQIAASLSEKLKGSIILQSQPQAQERLRDLLVHTSSPMISEIYRETLTSLLDDISCKKELSVDTRHLHQNYQYILLYILQIETSPTQLSFVLKKIHSEWKSLAEEANLDFMKSLYVTLIEKESVLSQETHWATLKNSTGKILESSLLDGNTSPYLDTFLDNQNESAFDVNFYLDKIFSGNVVTSFLLKAFFKFFKDYILYFNINIEEKRTDTAFLGKMIDCLKILDLPESAMALKQIFSIGDFSLKVKALKALEALSELDKKFLFSLLKKSAPSLKKEAFRVLASRENLKFEALKKLFRIPSPFGIRNKILQEHIGIVDDMRVAEAKDFLIPLSKRKFLWNKTLRKKARGVLEKWNEAKS